MRAGVPVALGSDAAAESWTLGRHLYALCKGKLDRESVWCARIEGLRTCFVAPCKKGSSGTGEDAALRVIGRFYVVRPLARSGWIPKTAGVSSRATFGTDVYRGVYLSLPRSPPEGEYLIERTVS